MISDGQVKVQGFLAQNFTGNEDDISDGTIVRLDQYSSVNNKGNNLIVINALTPLKRQNDVIGKPVSFSKFQQTRGDNALAGAVSNSEANFQVNALSTAPQSNPYTQSSTSHTNPYAAQSNPYAHAPAHQPNPYAQTVTVQSNPYAQPTAAPATVQSNPYAQAPAAHPNPYAQTAANTNPYAQAPVAQPNPYAQTSGAALQPNPYQQQPNPYGNKAPTSALQGQAPVARPNPYVQNQTAQKRPGPTAGGGPVRQQTGDGSDLTPISGLNIYTQRWTIQARVSTKSDLRKFTNAKGEGQVFNIELRDAQVGKCVLKSVLLSLLGHRD
jgi:replication factor A1